MVLEGYGSGIGEGLRQVMLTGCDTPTPAGTTLQGGESERERERENERERERGIKREREREIKRERSA